MALVIDGSSPASSVANDPTNPNVCASFTPPDDSLLVACWAGDSASTDPSTPVVSGGGLSWTVDAFDHRTSGTPTQNGQAAIAHALIVGASPGSMTVSVTNGVSTQRGSVLSVFVFTGHDPAAPIGVAGGFRQAGGSSFSQSWTSGITGGQGLLAVCDWNETATAGWTGQDAATTILTKGDVVGEISYGVLYRTTPDEVVGTSTSLGVTGIATGSQLHWAYAEVISLEAALAAAGQGGTYGDNPPMF